MDGKAAATALEEAQEAERRSKRELVRQREVAAREKREVVEPLLRIRQNHLSEQLAEMFARGWRERET